MKNDNLKNYLQLRDALSKEKAEIETRLREINSALGARDFNSASSAAAPRGRGRTRGRGNNAVSLKVAVMRLTNGRALSKEEILEGLDGIGYKFTTKNPTNSLGVILYGKAPKFNRDNGRFILAPGQTIPGEEPAAKAKK